MSLLACRYCATENIDCPMLRDDLWAIVSPSEGRLRPDIVCLDCVERQLGRIIYTEDLNNSAWSNCVRAIVKRELARSGRLL